jgi:tetratricopeptide (TPR) repeat protein
MSDTVRCPDCGHANPAGAESCAECNFPLPARAPVHEPAPPERATAGAAPPIIRRPPRRPPRGDRTSQALWLFFGLVCVVVLVATAVRGFRKNNIPAVEGASPGQQQNADSLRDVLAHDSTNVGAQVALGNILYDTGNWPEAVRHYAVALARDSSLTSALVDLGVSYYNMSETDQAERMFRLALNRDPHQPIALFNLGIVAERREDWRSALQYFHRAMESNPPESMQQALNQQMEQAMTKLGVKAPALPQGAGAAPGGAPGGP